MSKEKGVIVAWVVGINEKSLIAILAGNIVWTQHSYESALQFAREFDARKFIDNLPYFYSKEGLKVMPVYGAPETRGLQLAGYFVKPYENSDTIERVDDSCKDDEDVFPLYRKLEHPVVAAEAITLLNG